MKSRLSLFALVAVSCVILTGTIITSTNAGVTVEISQDCYSVGDSVWCTVNNNSEDSLMVRNLPGMEFWNDDADTLVYPYWVYPMAWYIEPGTSQPFGWDQLDYHDNQVPVGTYRFVLDGVLGEAPIILEETFGIGGPSSAESGTWGSIKALYR